MDCAQKFPHLSQVRRSVPRGGTRSIHDGGGPTYFFGLKIYTLGIFLGQEICHVFFRSYLRANFSFRVFVAISGSEKYSFEPFFSDVCSVFLYFFGLEILMPGIFLGIKFQACVFFWVCNMKLRRTPRHVYFEYPPGDLFNAISLNLIKQMLLPGLRIFCRVLVVRTSINIKTFICGDLCF